MTKGNAGDMMNREKMRRELFILFVVVLILSVPNFTVAHPPHHDYDEAELDLSAVYSSLNLTKDEMIVSLNHSLHVNYTQSHEEDMEEYEYGYIHANYNNETFDLIEKTQKQIHSDLSNVKELIHEIEYDVPSYVYLRRYYIPFYELSENLTLFSGNHHSFVQNMTRGVSIFNSLSENETVETLYPDLQNGITNASAALRSMSDSLDDAEKNIDKIEERAGAELFDFAEMEKRIDALRELIEEYGEYLDLLTEAQIGLPAFLTAIAPPIVHPGEKIPVEGVYVEGYLFSLDSEYKQYLEEDPIPEDLIEAFEENGHPLFENSDIIETDGNEKWLIRADSKNIYSIESRFRDGTEVLDIYLAREFSRQENLTIFLNEKEMAKNESRENNYYRADIKIPWNIFLEEGPLHVAPGEEIELRVESDDQNITSGVNMIKADRWSSEMKLNLEGEKEEFFDENFSIEGHFVCEAPVAFKTIDLNATPNTEIEKHSDFSFSLSYHTDAFDWGENTIEITYLGNETMYSVSEQITFDKNIPTHLTIGLNEEDTEHLHIEGKLVNASSEIEEGLENKEVVLKLNGERWVTTTDSEGYYNFSLPLDLIEAGDVIYAHFEGDLMFRESTSEEIEIGDDLVAEEPDPLIDPLDIGIKGFILIMIIVMGLVATLFLWKKDEGLSVLRREPASKLSAASTKKKRKKITRKKISSLQADSKSEVSTAYGKLLNELDSEGLISVKKGKTHRELERELVLKTGLKDEIRNMTLVFEKALFTDQSIVSSDLQSFNSSLKQIEEELL